MTAAQTPGPEFTLIEETTWDALRARGHDHTTLFERPMLVKGGLTQWPAYQRWSFEHLAQCVQASHADGRALTTKFTDGLVEQGITQGRLTCPWHRTCKPWQRRHWHRLIWRPRCCRCHNAKPWPLASSFT